MDLEGRRKSENVEDRRDNNSSTAKKAAGGIGGVLLAGLLAFFLGGDPATEVATDFDDSVIQTEQEEEFYDFALQILASTEDVWTEEFKKLGKTYTPPTLVLFHGSTESACGGANASTGPFYCNGDKRIYLDLDYFNSTLVNKLGADGDFAFAYVIAHEVGHHVQYLLGDMKQVYLRMQSVSQTEQNQWSVRLELGADYLAGVWANHEEEMFGSLEEGDIEEAITLAERIGDDYLQNRSKGYNVPETFQHGTSEQRVKWFQRGLSSGSVAANDRSTYSQQYAEL
jgi:hypothetical protein